MTEVTKKLNFLKANPTADAQKSKILSRVKSLQLISGARRQKRPNSLGALEELVQCGICLEKLNQPRMLPCQHTFCLSCLQSHVMAKDMLLRQNGLAVGTKPRRFFQCPTCSQKHPLENGMESVDGLPVNMYIVSLLKLLEKSSPSGSGGEYVFESRCVKCQMACEKHKLVCQHCLQVFCNICWGEHILEMEHKLSTLSKQLEESDSRLEHKLENFEKRCDQLEETIKYTAKEKIEQIKELERNATMDVKALKGERKKNAKELKKRIDEIRSNVKTYQNLDESQKVAAFVNMHKETSILVDDVFHWGETRTIFDPHTFTLDEDSEGIYNELEEETINGVRILQNPLDNPDTLSAYYRTRSFTTKLVWSKCPRPAGVGIPPWDTNHLYIAATDSQVVLIMDRQRMRPLGRLTSPEMLCPQNVAFSEKRNEVYVSDKSKHCVHVFSSNGEYLRSLGSKGFGDGKFRSPDGIAVGPRQELVVCDTGNDRVVLLDPVDGRQLNQLGVHGKHTELNVPTGVAVSDDGIIVADSGNHRIKVYNSEGEKQLEFGSLGRNKGQFRSAEVVAVDPMGFILVGDAGNGRIQVFKPDGGLVRIFGVQSEKSGWISGIVVTPELDIIVTDIRNRSIQIF